MNTIGKEDLVVRLFEQNDEIISKAQSARVIDTLTEIILEALENGDKVRLNNIGSLEPVERAAREGASFGKKYSTPAYKSVRFAVSKSLKDRLNG